MPPVNYTIRRYKHGDRRSVLTLWRRRFGETSSFLRQDLRETVTGLENISDLEWYIRAVTGLVLEADSGQIHGFIVGRIGPADEIAEYFNGAVTADDIANQAGLVTEVAVSKTVEGMGLASELVAALEPWFINNHVECIYTISWRRDGHDSYDLFTSQGYEEIAHSERFYENRLECPDCGPNCTCPATVMEKDPDSSIGEVSRVDPVQLRATPEYGARRVPDV